MSRIHNCGFLSASLFILYSWCMPLYAASGVDAERQIIRIALASEPPSLNSLTSQDQFGSFILGHTKEGLMRYNAEGQLEGAVASHWQREGLTWRFTLRKGARWHDGRQVQAEDFVTAWRAVLDPKTGAPNAHLLYPIAGAEGINLRQAAPETLAVRALDERTLEVRLKEPLPYFLALTAYATYLPVHPDYLERFGPRYAAEADHQAYNGPFVLETWVHGARLTMERNPHYWEQDAIRLNGIYIDHITADPLAVMNLFSDGSIAMTDIGVDSLDLSLRRGLPLHHYPVANLFYLRFNFAEGRWTTDPDLRQAIFLSLNPDELVNKVIALPGFQVARSLFPRYMRSQGTRLWDYAPPEVVFPNVTKARAHLEAFMQRHGLTEVPSLTLLTSDSPGAAKQAEYFQNALKLALGLDLRLDKQIFKQRLAKENQGLFDIAMSGWGPDYNDPMTFADLFASWNPNNRGRYLNADYDRWLAIAQTSQVSAERLEAFANLHRILAADLPLIPLYENALIYVKHPRLHGVFRSRFGADPVYHRAWVEAP